MPAAFFVVLTAAPGSGTLTDATVEAARHALAAYGAPDARWLAPGEAWEIGIEAGGQEPHAARAAVEHAIAPAPVDVNVVAPPAASRRKQLLAADMESTVIREELIDEMADMVGCRAEVAAVTEAAMRGEIDFERALIRRVALFKGLAVDRLGEILGRVTPMPGAAALVRTLRAQGSRCALVSGGFTVFAEPIARRLGFDTVVANELVIENGKLTGEVAAPIVGPESKANALTRLAEESGLDLAETLAVGDGANDLVMLRRAGLGVAFRAKPILAAAARALPTGAVVTHGDLTALLYLQGVGRTAFAV